MTEPSVLDALRPVQDPELHRSIVDLGMVKGIAIDGGTRAGPDRPHRRRLPAAQRDPAAGSPPPCSPSTAPRPSTSASRVMTDEERAAVRELLHGEPGGDRRLAARPRPRPGPGHPVRRPGVAHPRAARRLGQGRRRQVVGHHQPRRRPRAAGQVRRCRRRRRVGLLDPAHARRRAAAGRDRLDARAARVPRRPRDLDGVLRRGGRRRSSGGARCCTRRSSSSSPTSSGTSPTSSSSTCRPAPATSRSRWRSSCPAPRSTSSRRRSRRRRRWRSGPASWPRKVQLTVKGVIENMSWFTGDDGKRYELFGAGGGQELADLLEVPLLGQVPLAPDAARGRRRRRADRRHRPRLARPPRPSPRSPAASTRSWRRPGAAHRELKIVQ